MKRVFILNLRKQHILKNSRNSLVLKLMSKILIKQKITIDLIKIPLNDKAPIAYKIGSHTFLIAILFIDEKTITIDDSQQHKEELAPCFQNNVYLISNKICQQIHNIKEKD